MYNWYQCIISLSLDIHKYVNGRSGASLECWSIVVGDNRITGVEPHLAFWMFPGLLRARLSQQRNSSPGGGLPFWKKFWTILNTFFNCRSTKIIFPFFIISWTCQALFLNCWPRFMVVYTVHKDESVDLWVTYTVTYVCFGLGLQTY